MTEYNLAQHLQDDESTDCGPISTLMILNYFGITSDRQLVLKKVQRSTFGTSSFANALVMQEYGLDTTLITIQPKIFDGDFIHSKPSDKSILKKVLGTQRNEKDKDKKHNLGMLASYLEKGGHFKLAIPTKQIIIDALSAGKLVWLSAYTMILGPDEGGYHAMVVAGYKDNQFLLYNPWPKSKRKSWENADEVMFAIHSVTDFDYDNGAIIVVGKKSS